MMNHNHCSGTLFQNSKQKFLAFFLTIYQICVNNFYSNRIWLRYWWSRFLMILDPLNPTMDYFPREKSLIQHQKFLKFDYGFYSNLISTLCFIYLFFFCRHYNNVDKQFKFSRSKFFNSLCHTFKHDALIPFSLILIQDCFLKSLRSIMIGWIIRNLLSESSSSIDRIWIISALCSSSLLLILMHHLSMFLLFRLSIRAKIIWSTMIYNKVIIFNTYNDANNFQC